MGGDEAQWHPLLLRTNLESATQNCSLVPQTAAGSCWNVGGVWRLFHGSIRGGVTGSSPDRSSLDTRGVRNCKADHLHCLGVVSGALIG